MKKSWLLIVGLIVIGVGIWCIIGASSHSDKIGQIESRVDEIHFSASVEKTQCAGGGVDTSEWCTYEVNAPITTVIKDLTAAGYNIESKSKDNATLVGGTPKMTISVNADDETSSIEARILEAGRTI